MKTTLKLKINMLREYLGLIIYPQKPSAGLPNFVRLSLQSPLIMHRRPEKMANTEQLAGACGP
jgi:hypothetical protein